MKKINVGFIGFGFIGKVHAYGYQNLPMYYDPLPFQPVLAHVCTSRLDTAKAGAKMIGAAHAVTDYRAITENPDIGIVHICTPNHLHHAIVMQSAEAGKHVITEKPPAMSLRETDEMIETCRKAKVKFGCFVQCRIRKAPRVKP